MSASTPNLSERQKARLLLGLKQRRQMREYSQSMFRCLNAMGLSASQASYFNDRMPELLTILNSERIKTIEDTDQHNVVPPVCG